VANIGARGIRQRRITGVVWLVLGVAALVVMLLTRAPRGARLWLAIPFALARLGLLQARAKT
jgi:hypothetical protein